MIVNTDQKTATATTTPIMPYSSVLDIPDGENEFLICGKMIDLGKLLSFIDIEPNISRQNILIRY